MYKEHIHLPIYTSHIMSVLFPHRSENWDDMPDDDLFTRVTSIVGTDVGGLTERIKKLDMDFDFLRQVDINSSILYLYVNLHLNASPPHALLLHISTADNAIWKDGGMETTCMSCLHFQCFKISH